VRKCDSVKAWIWVNVRKCVCNGKSTRANGQERFRSFIRHRGGRIRRPTFHHRTDERFNRPSAFGLKKECSLRTASQIANVNGLVCRSLDHAAAGAVLVPIDEFYFSVSRRDTVPSCHIGAIACVGASIFGTTGGRLKSGKTRRSSTPS
jgi:hypothetical protein